jgi:hypothetical protein
VGVFGLGLMSIKVDGVLFGISGKLDAMLQKEGGESLMV